MFSTFQGGPFVEVFTRRYVRAPTDTRISRNSRMS